MGNETLLTLENIADTTWFTPRPIAASAQAATNASVSTVALSVLRVPKGASALPGYDPSAP